MTVPDVSLQSRCLATLELLPAGGLSRAAQWDLAGGRHRFPASITLVRESVHEHRQTAMQRMSISGMQDKISLRLHRGVLLPVEKDGTHILKPIPSTRFHLVDDTPANEALTMLLARRAGLTTAAHGLVRLADSELAYITRRFDRLADGSRVLQEDLGSVAGMSADTHGGNWKYDSTYEALGWLIKNHCSATMRDLIEFVHRVIFCFVIGNGDAHVRNFSLIRDRDGFTQLSPAYDLLCTRVHLPDEADLGLNVLNEEKDGRFSPSYETFGFYTGADFSELGRRLGLATTVVSQLLKTYLDPTFRLMIADYVGRSFLSQEAKLRFVITVNERLAKLASA